MTEARFPPVYPSPSRPTLPNATDVSTLGHLKLQITVEDPQTFTVPWAFDLNSQVQADNELLEFVCEGNEDILRHMVVGSR
jgi:hypothetical protein